MRSDSAHDAVLTPYSKNLISYLSRQIKRRRAFRSDSQEDLEQEITAFLISRARHFDPSRASSNTFADRVIRSGIAMMERDRLRKKRAPALDNVSIDQVDRASDNASRPLGDALTVADLGRRFGAADAKERAERIRYVREVIESLPPDEQELCLRLKSGSQATVARELGMTVRQVKEAIGRIRKRFDAGGFGNS